MSLNIHHKTVPTKAAYLNKLYVLWGNSKQMGYMPYYSVNNSGYYTSKCSTNLAIHTKGNFEYHFKLLKETWNQILLPAVN